tara:strand:- start:155 stop:526 length:372 start_codon:yes stop_codon:yes gene_type:complete
MVFTPTTVDRFEIYKIIFNKKELLMDKKIKVQVPSSSGDYFIDVDLTENQNNFLNKFNQIVDKKLYAIFDALIEEIAATPEYKNINKSELYRLYHDIAGSIWSGAALTTLLSRFYGKKIKPKN